MYAMECSARSATAVQTFPKTVLAARGAIANQAQGIGELANRSGTVGEQLLGAHATNEMKGDAVGHKLMTESL